MVSIKYITFAFGFTLLTTRVLSGVIISLNIDPQELLSAENHAVAMNRPDNAINEEPVPIASNSGTMETTNCGTTGDIFNFISLNADPYPIKPYECLFNSLPCYYGARVKLYICWSLYSRPGNVTVSLKGSLTEVLEEGAYFEVKVKLGLVKLLSKQYDLCEELRVQGRNLQCSLSQGDVTFQYDVQFNQPVPLVCC